MKSSQSISEEGKRKSFIELETREDKARQLAALLKEAQSKYDIATGFLKIKHIIHDDVLRDLSSEGEQHDVLVHPSDPSRILRKVCFYKGNKISNSDLRAGDIQKQFALIAQLYFKHTKKTGGEYSLEELMEYNKFLPITYSTIELETSIKNLIFTVGHFSDFDKQKLGKNCISFSLFFSVYRLMINNL